MLGGKSGTIRVINRPSESGTRQIFQELVLKGEDFGNTSNIETLNRDATTPMLRALGTDGIGYATFSQVANQMTVRTVAVDGLTPEASSYPYQRLLFYVYREPANPGVKAFLGYFGSPKGQKIVVDALN
jgi:phosphate transport system substrate-binding protein